MLSEAFGVPLTYLLIPNFGVPRRKRRSPISR